MGGLLPLSLCICMSVVDACRFVGLDSSAMLMLTYYLRRACDRCVAAAAKSVLKLNGSASKPLPDPSVGDSKNHTELPRYLCFIR